jgi:hypothetical protein
MDIVILLSSVLACTAALCVFLEWLDSHDR